MMGTAWDDALQKQTAPKMIDRVACRINEFMVPSVSVSAELQAFWNPARVTDVLGCIAISNASGKLFRTLGRFTDNELVSSSRGLEASHPALRRRVSTIDSFQRTQYLWVRFNRRFATSANCDACPGLQSLVITHIFSGV
jgi:hypothetical protein